jgi:hypothetical protein
MRSEGTLMDALLMIHFDSVDGGEVWWAESPHVPGFSASAETLSELRSMIAELIPDISSDLGEAVRFSTEVLADASPMDAAARAPIGEGYELHTDSEGGRAAVVRIPALSS